MLGSFLLCPCHLPATIAGLALLTGGTALSPMIRDNPVVIGVLSTTLWLAGTWYGARVIRRSVEGIPAAPPVGCVAQGLEPGGTTTVTSPRSAQRATSTAVPATSPGPAGRPSHTASCTGGRPVSAARRTASSRAT